MVLPFRYDVGVTTNINDERIAPGPYDYMGATVRRTELKRKRNEDLGPDNKKSNRSYRSCFTNCDIY